MNIILFLNKDFEANLVYNLIKEELLNHNVKIYYSESVGKKNSKPEALLEIEHYEKTYFYGDLQESMQNNKIDTDFEFFNESFSSFPLLKCTNVNSPEFIAEVSAFEPDLFLSIRFGKIFKDGIIGVPKKGILNLHSAILPDYRGIMGTLHNLKEEKPQYGCTLHYIDQGTIDTGQIIDIARLNVDKKRSLLWHVIKLYPVGAQLLLQSIEQLKTTERLPSTEQDMTEGSYFSLPTEHDFEILNTCGIKSFDLKDYAELINEYISPEIHI